MNVLKMDLCRAIHSKEFFLAVLIMAIIGYAAVNKSLIFIVEHTIKSQEITILMILSELKRDGMYLMSIPIACAIIYATAFYDELSYRFIIFSLSRCSRKRYICSKVSTIIITSGVSVLVAWLVMIISCVFALEQRNMSITIDYNNIIKSMGFLTLLIIQSCLSGVMWALVGASASIIMNSKYMAYIVPFMSFYILDVFQKRYYTNRYYLNPSEWMSAAHIGITNCILLLSVVCVFFIFTLTLMMKRKIRDV